MKWGGLYTEATERSLMDVGNNVARHFHLPRYYCVSFQPPMACVNQPKALIANECYHYQYGVK
jgi:hypothetical protein